jgi:hypothetical protein
MDKRILVGSALVFSLLSACGGGGSGGGVSSTPAPPINTPPPPPPPPPPPTTFTNWQAAPSNGVVRVSGSTVEAPSTNPTGLDVAGRPNIYGTYGTISAGDLTADITYTSSSQTGFAVRGGQSSVNFTNSDGSTKTRLAASPSIIKYASGTTTLYVADPSVAGYSYMTYGAWGGATATGRLNNGFHGGSVTPSGSVPTTGSVTYTGTSVGYYSDLGGTRISESTGTVTLAADFGSRSLVFRSGAGSQPMFGTLTYNAGSNMFSGRVVSEDPIFSSAERLFGWSGTLSGRFYGPAGQEVAGTFFMTSTFGTCSPGCQYVGAFGAKRP